IDENDEREVAALADRLAETAAIIDSAIHRFLTDLRRFDEMQGWAKQGALTAAHWLSWRVGLDLGAAREKMRVAIALGSLPAIDDALRRGEVSYSKVRAMTRVATAANESALLQIARASTASQLEAVVSLYRQQQPPPVEVEKRRMRLRTTADGMVRVDLKLTPDEAALVAKACALAANGGDHAAGLTAMAEQVLRRGGLDPSEEDSADDARVSAETHPPTPGQHRPPVEVLLHIDAGTLTGHTEAGHGVSAETCRRILCDAGMAPVLDADGKPLNVGRKRRTIPTALRRALLCRDK